MEWLQGGQRRGKHKEWEKDEEGAAGVSTGNIGIDEEALVDWLDGEEEEEEIVRTVLAMESVKDVDYVEGGGGDGPDGGGKE